MYDDLLTTVNSLKKEISTIQNKLNNFDNGRKIPATMIKTISFILIGNACLIFLGFLLISSIATWLVINLISLLTNLIIGVSMWMVMRK